MAIMDYDAYAIKRLKRKELPPDKKGNEKIEYTLDDAKFEFTIKEKMSVTNFYDRDEIIEYHITIPFTEKKFNIHITYTNGSNRKVITNIKEKDIIRMLKKNNKSKFIMEQKFDPNKYTLYQMPKMNKSYPLQEFIEILRSGVPLNKNKYTSTYVKQVLLFKDGEWIGIGKRHGREWKYITQEVLTQIAIKVSKINHEKIFKEITDSDPNMLAD